MGELDAMTGLAGVKARVREFKARAEAQAARRRSGMAAGGESTSTHMFFLGNPGTGKTVVARLVGRMFFALGLRTSAAMKEVTLHDVLSPNNTGETVEKMKAKIAEAMGGVLFI